MSLETYYSVLGVREAATQQEIKAAYRRLVRQVHPDSLPGASANRKRAAEEKTKEINEAYGVLSDLTMRHEYDRLLQEARRNTYTGTAATTSTPPNQPTNPPPASRPQSASPYCSKCGMALYKASYCPVCHGFVTPSTPPPSQPTSPVWIPTDSIGWRTWCVILLASLLIGHFLNPSPEPKRQGPYPVAPQNPAVSIPWPASNPQLVGNVYPVKWPQITLEQLIAASRVNINFEDLLGSAYPNEELPSPLFRSGPETGLGETRRFMGGKCAWKNLDRESKEKWIQEGTLPNYVFMISPAGETCYIRNPAVDFFLAKGAVKGVPVLRAGIVVGYNRPDVLRHSKIETELESGSTVSSPDLPVEPMPCADEISSASDETSTAKPVDPGQLTTTNQEKASTEAACLTKYSEPQSRDDLSRPMAAVPAGPRRADLSQCRLGEMQSVQSPCE